jgi:ABC-type nickel/cobalt efflux system permease component RcnA
LALAPGETSESFIREVDENLRRDQAEAVFKRYGKWIIAAAVLLLVAVGGWLFWKNQQAEQAAANSEQFAAILTDVGQRQDGDDAAARGSMRWQHEGNGSMAGAARLTRAALALQKSDRPPPSRNIASWWTTVTCPRPARHRHHPPHPARVRQPSAAAGDRAPCPARGQGQRLVRLGR